MTTLQIEQRFLDNARVATAQELVTHYETTRYDRGGKRVLFLDDATFTTASTTQSAGRIGYLERSVAVDDPADEYQWYCQSSGSEARGYHRRLAIVNPPIDIGNRVVSLDETYGTPSPGEVGEVTDMTGNQVLIRLENGNSAWIGRWALAAGEQPNIKPIDPAHASEEDLQISDWWIQRIKRIAREAKRRYGFCGSIDSVVRDLLEPVLPRWRAVPAEGGGYDIFDGDGVKKVWYSELDEAEKYIKAKNQEIRAL